MIVVIALIIVCIKLASEAVQRRRADAYATQAVIGIQVTAGRKELRTGAVEAIP